MACSSWIPGPLPETVLTCRLEDFMENGPTWLAQVPTVERVVLSDREPYPLRTGDGFSWGVGVPPAGSSQHYLPQQIALCLQSEPGLGFLCYPTREAAMDALSAALILWAKETGK